MKFLTLFILITTLVSTARSEIDDQPALREGLDTALSPVQLNEISKWTESSRFVLTDLLSYVESLPIKQKKENLIRVIKNTVVDSYPNAPDTLLRFTLNRSVELIRIIDQEIGSKKIDTDPGVLDQEVRVLTSGVAVALKYTQSEMEYVDGIVKGTKNLTPPNYAQFGIEFAQTMFGINESLVDISAQYQVAGKIIQWFKKDLATDRNHVAYNDVLKKIEYFPLFKIVSSDTPDRDMIFGMKQLRKLFWDSTDFACKVAGVETHRSTSSENPNPVVEAGYNKNDRPDRKSDYSTKLSTSCASGYVEGRGFTGEGGWFLKDCYLRTSLGSSYQTRDNVRCTQGYSDGTSFTAKDGWFLKWCQKLN